MVSARYKQALRANRFCDIAVVQKIADNEPWKMPATIDDPAILDEIKVALEGIGYGHSRPA